MSAWPGDDLPGEGVSLLPGVHGMLLRLLVVDSALEKSGLDWTVTLGDNWGTFCRRRFA